MKKIITIIFALALCACAYAKSITELRAEFESVATGDWATKCAFFEANAADLGKAWDAYKGNIKPTWDDQTAIFLLAYVSGEVDFTGSDWQLCCLHDIHKAARAQISTLNKALTARLLDAKLIK